MSAISTSPSGRARHPEVVGILGMHRSGTSCLAGSLEEAGLELGTVNTAAPYNRKGNRENEEIQRLNEAVLVANGGEWRRPPATVHWSPELRARRDAVIASYAGRERWGFKDPRTILTFDGWREALPGLRVVATFRHPLACAASLAGRGRWGPEDPLALWIAYNRRLLELHAELRFPLVSFDAPPAEYAAELERLCGMLGLTPPRGGFAFFEAALRQRAATGGEVPADAAAVYDQLHAAAAAA